jgi:hypothetical protein
MGHIITCIMTIAGVGLAKLLLREVEGLHGLPRTIASDSEHQFASTSQRQIF